MYNNSFDWDSFDIFKNGYVPILKTSSTFLIYIIILCLFSQNNFVQIISGQTTYQFPKIDVPICDFLCFFETTDKRMYTEKIVGLRLIKCFDYIVILF